MPRSHDRQCPKCTALLRGPLPHPLDAAMVVLAIFQCGACGAEVTFRKTDRGLWSRRALKSPSPLL